ncbi:MAG: hypothetical protein U0X73_12765 [Thermoanaerobaculia bacterium]
MGATSAYYGAPISDFLAADPPSILGALVAADPYDTLEAVQRGAWEEEIEAFRVALSVDHPSRC